MERARKNQKSIASIPQHNVTTDIPPFLLHYGFRSNCLLCLVCGGFAFCSQFCFNSFSYPNRTSQTRFEIISNHLFSKRIHQVYQQMLLIVEIILRFFFWFSRKNKIKENSRNTAKIWVDK